MSEDLFDRHINPSAKLVIGEDTFYLKPLKYKYMPKFWKLINSTSKFKEGENTFNDEIIELLLELEYATIKESYPDIKEEKLQDFVRDNMFSIFPIMMELNIPPSEEIENIVKKVKANESNKIKS